MEQTSAHLARRKVELTRELAKVRRASMEASERRDFRAVARLTMETARLNQAIAQMEVNDACAR